MPRLVEPFERTLRGGRISHCERRLEQNAGVAGLPLRLPVFLGERQRPALLPEQIEVEARLLLLVQLVTGKPSADPNALTPESIAARLQPVGRVEFGGAAGGAGPRSGEQIVKTVCAACHQTGVANAPKLGDKAAWASRIKEGLPQMVKDAINGAKAMPPRGGDASLTDDEVTRAVVYMLNLAGAKFKEPAAPAAQKTAAAAADGKKIYDTTCVACHATGVANAPKLGDKAAWAPRIKGGTDALLQSVIKGKGAMPPKAGNPSASDAELRAAVEFMVSQSK